MLDVVLYGIRNCDTMKRARAWLDARGVAYRVHDYKSEGIAPEMLTRWVDELGWEAVLNRTGTTFRKLPDAAKQDLTQGRAMQLMLAQPSMIRRPVLDLGSRRIVGFSAEVYEVALA